MAVTRTRDGGQSFDVLTDGLPQEHAYDLVYRHALDIDGSGDRLLMGSTTGNLWWYVRREAGQLGSSPPTSPTHRLCSLLLASSGFSRGGAGEVQFDRGVQRPPIAESLICWSYRNRSHPRGRPCR